MIERPFTLMTARCLVGLDSEASMHSQVSACAYAPSFLLTDHSARKHCAPRSCFRLG